MAHGGWYPDWVLRLVPANAYAMETARVHERLRVPGPVASLGETVLIEAGIYSWDGADITDEVAITGADPGNPPQIQGTGDGQVLFRASAPSGPIVVRDLLVTAGPRGGLASVVRTDLTIEIDVLRDRLAREGVRIKDT